MAGARHESTRRGERANAAASLLCGHAGLIPFSVAKDSTFLACCFAAIIPAYNAKSVVFIIPFTGGHPPSAGGVDQPTTQQLTETDDGGGDRFQGKGSRGKLRPGRSEFYGRGAADVSGTRRGGSTGAGLRAGATAGARGGAWILARISASAACRLVISRLTWS